MHWKILIKGDNDILNGSTFRYGFDGKQSFNQANSMNMAYAMFVNISSVNLLKKKKKNICMDGWNGEGLFSVGDNRNIILSKFSVFFNSYGMADT